MKTQGRGGQGMELWRYGIISEFLHGDSAGITMHEKLNAAAKRQWRHPKGHLVALSADTLRHWIYRYRKAGIDGLRQQTRLDCGSSSIPTIIRDKFQELREEHPQYTTQRLLHILSENGIWKGSECSRSAFYRYAKEHGLGRKRIGAELMEQASAFAYQEFGQMWTADYMHGPHIRTGKERRKTYLLAIIDDASRFVVHAQFYLSEGVESLLDGLSTAVRRFGVPRRFYTDNGSAFRSDHLKVVAARLAMHLPHTPARRPQGRGKVERFFRTVRDQWLPKDDVVSLDSLNTKLNQWLQGHHNTVHSSLKESPLSRRLAIAKATREVPEVQNLERLFRMHTTRLVNRNGTISLEGKMFDVQDAIPGQKVSVCYLPWDLSEIWVGAEQSPAKAVDLYRNANRYTNKPTRKAVS